MLLLLSLGVMPRAYGQQEAPQAAAAPDTSQGNKVLDSVIAVVNNQVILRSDLDLEMRVFALLPTGDRQDASAPRSLERLTTRALIEQQILQDDPQGMEIAPKELQDSLAELRQNLPGCRRRDCASVNGWKDYLATLDLTPMEVDTYWSNRMAILRFIEQRFRSGIRVTPEEIRTYYQEKLVPMYAKQEDAPQLERVSPRIQEILLQQRVNELMNDWLKSLQDQGQVEVLDPALRTEATKPGADGVGPAAERVPILPHKKGRKDSWTEGGNGARSQGAVTDGKGGDW